MYRALARTGVDPAEEDVAERASARASAAAPGSRLAQGTGLAGPRDLALARAQGNDDESELFDGTRGGATGWSRTAPRTSVPHRSGSPVVVRSLAASRPKLYSMTR